METPEIQRMTALERAVDLALKGAIATNSVIGVANEYYTFLTTDDSAKQGTVVNINNGAHTD